MDPFELWDGGVPPGPPPPECLPPCLWDLFVDCGWPGAGTPLLDPRTCQQTYTDSSGVLLCDSEAGYLFEAASRLPNASLSFYSEGELCARRSSGGGVSGGIQIFWWDALDRQVASVAPDQSAQHLPLSAWCNNYDDDADVSRTRYELDLADPICAWWLYIYGLPSSDYYSPNVPTVEPCPRGTCPKP